MQILRVIGGTHRGRRLEAPEGRGTRPILDRQKESLFNILSKSFPCEGVLDLFAGSGGLGIEALSRGAGEATFVERGRPASGVLLRNLEVLSLTGCSRVLTMDALRLEPQRIGHPLGVIFCDPPFPLYGEARSRVGALLLRIAEGAQLEPEAVFMLRVPAGAPLPDEADQLGELNRREMGESSILIFGPGRVL